MIMGIVDIAQANRVRSIDVSLAAQLDLVAYRMRPATPDLSSALIATGGAALSALPTDHAKAVVDSVSFSPDGHTLATADDDLTVRLWNTTADRLPPAESPATANRVSGRFACWRRGDEGRDRTLRGRS
jgi:WD40 repeat protein